jgi:hypothetical protein
MVCLAATFQARLGCRDLRLRGAGRDCHQHPTLRYISSACRPMVYLQDLIALTFTSETAVSAVFQAGDLYHSADSGHRRLATNSLR